MREIATLSASERRSAAAVTGAVRAVLLAPAAGLGARETRRALPSTYGDFDPIQNPQGIGLLPPTRPMRKERERHEMDLSEHQLLGYPELEMGIVSGTHAGSSTQD